MHMYIYMFSSEATLFFLPWLCGLNIVRVFFLTASKPDVNPSPNLQIISTRVMCRRRGVTDETMLSCSGPDYIHTSIFFCQVAMLDWMTWLYVSSYLSIIALVLKPDCLFMLCCFFSSLFLRFFFNTCLTLQNSLIKSAIQTNVCWKFVFGQKRITQYK